MERKQQIRAELTKKRNELTQKQTEAYSRKICEVLYQYLQKEHAEIIYCYYPLGKEVNVLPLAERLLQEGKKVAFPRTCGARMDFYAVISLSQFAEGAFHIMEPVGEVALKEETPFVIVPGLGFDDKKNRIGYGKGFYDRYFARFPSCRKIGAAYGTQLVKEVFADKYDIPMDVIITESEGIK